MKFFEKKMSAIEIATLPPAIQFILKDASRETISTLSISNLIRIMNAKAASLYAENAPIPVIVDCVLSATLQAVLAAAGAKIETTQQGIAAMIVEQKKSDAYNENEVMSYMAKQLVQHNVSAFAVKLALDTSKCLFETDGAEPLPEMTLMLSKITKLADAVVLEKQSLADSAHGNMSTGYTSTM